MCSGTVAVFGGSGFIGSYVVQKLLKCGFVVNLLTRSVEGAMHLKLFANLGHLNIVTGSIFCRDDILRVINGAHVVINCIGAIYGGKKNIYALNYEFPKFLLDVLHNSENDVEQIVHFSAILHEGTKDNYTRSKLDAKRLFRSSKFSVAVLSPSVVFGEEDNFFNFFASLSKYSFILPLINEGKSLVQPVCVLDIAEFVVRVIHDKESGEFYLVGPTEYSIRDIFVFICTTLNKKRFFLNMPDKLMRFIACLSEMHISYAITKLLVGKFQPLITVDQVNMLSFDSVSKVNSLLDFGIMPKSIEDIVPSYLGRYR